jgi:hypothetical protein
MTPSDFKLQQREWGKLTRQAAGRADKVALTLWRRLPAVDLVDPMMVITITAIPDHSTLSRRVAFFDFTGLQRIISGTIAR